MEIRYNETIVRDLGNYKIGGIASTFYNPNDPGTEFNIYGNVYERISRKAYDDCLGGGVLCRFDHKEVVGVTPDSCKLWLDDKGLNYECQLDKNDSFHREVYNRIQNHLVRGSSFEAKGYKAEWSRDGKKDIRTITKINKLVDVSPVYNPAYSSSTSLTRSNEIDIIRHEQQQWLKELESRARYEQTKQLLKELKI
jgi:HK97 family phage prohead protease